MIHADVFKTRNLIDKSKDPRVVVQRHLALIEQAAAGRPRWFATFNYDFLRSGQYDARSARCQVGALVGQSFEVIVANIDRKTILDMSHEFSKLRSSKTQLFLSGLLEEDEDDIVEMLSSLGWTQHAIRAREGWIALQFCVTSSA